MFDIEPLEGRLLKRLRLGRGARGVTVQVGDREPARLATDEVITAVTK
jgi:hypothetical protein